MSCLCNEINLTLNLNGSPNIVEDEHRRLHCSLRMDLNNGIRHLRVSSKGLRVTAERKAQQTPLRASGSTARRAWQSALAKFFSPRVRIAQSLWGTLLTVFLEQLYRTNANAQCS